MPYNITNPTPEQAATWAQEKIELDARLAQAKADREKEDMSADIEYAAMQYRQVYELSYAQAGIDNPHDIYSPQRLEYMSNFAHWFTQWKMNEEVEHG